MEMKGGFGNDGAVAPAGAPAVIVLHHSPQSIDNDWNFMLTDN